MPTKLPRWTPSFCVDSRTQRWCAGIQWHDLSCCHSIRCLWWPRACTEAFWMARPAHGSLVCIDVPIGVRVVTISSKSTTAWVPLSSAGSKTWPSVLVHGDGSRMPRMCGSWHWKGRNRTVPAWEAGMIRGVEVLPHPLASQDWEVGGLSTLCSYEFRHSCFLSSHSFYNSS